MLCSCSARNTPTWARPRAAPPERANAIVGGWPLLRFRSIGPIFRSSFYRIQHYDFRTFTRGIQKCIGIRFNLRLRQCLLNLDARLFKSWNNLSRRPGTQARNKHITIIVSDLRLTDYYKATKTEVKILLHLETLFDDFIQFLTVETYPQQSLRKLGLRLNLAR